jgi:N-methylhydantoinase A
MLAEGKLAGGVTLDIDASRTAIESLAEPLDLQLEEVARGVVTIVTANMANAIREITVEQGQDPRDCTLMPFGGAGPLFGTLLAQELDMTEVVIPPVAGNFSAWGLLGADLVRTASRTRIVRLEDGVMDEVNELASRLFARLDERVVESEVGEREIGLDMRYAGQEHYLTVAAPTTEGRVTSSATMLRELFTRDYDRTFAHTMDGAIEIVAVRATVRMKLPRRQSGRGAGAAPVEQQRTLDAWSFARGGRTSFRVIERSTIGPDATVVGPAIILEPTATTYLDEGWSARVREAGSLFLSREG